VLGSVLEASEERPYLCFRLDLDLVALGELALSHGDAGPVREDGTLAGLALSEADPGLIDAATRLVRLLEEPDHVGVLAPLVEREILYRLLTSPQGAMVRHIATSESRLSQIGRAIGWIKDNFSAPFSVERLAEVAGMSASSFHEHFRQVTAMTPLQYRDQLRLHEARRLMVVEALDAANAGFRVGYESPSQFSRVYVRAFGFPPARDAIRLRAGAVSAMAV
jgi:AraC-like DNA-binding protein